MLDAFFITVIMGLSHGATTSDSEYRDALKKFNKAVYKQTGINERVKKLEKRHIPEKLRVYGGWTIQISRVLIEQKVTYEWTF